MNTKIRSFDDLDSVSKFIFRLGLEDFAESYQIYFKKYGFSVEEEDHVEKMIGSSGAQYILKHNTDEKSSRRVVPLGTVLNK